MILSLHVCKVAQHIFRWMRPSMCLFQKDAHVLFNFPLSFSFHIEMLDELPFPLKIPTSTNFLDYFTCYHFSLVILMPPQRRRLMTADDWDFQEGRTGLFSSQASHHLWMLDLMPMPPPCAELVFPASFLVSALADIFRRAEKGLRMTWIRRQE